MGGHPFAGLPMRNTKEENYEKTKRARHPEHYNSFHFLLTKALDHAHEELEAEIHSLCNDSMSLE